MNAVKMPGFAAERKFFANRLANLYVGLADEIVGGRKPTEVGYGL